MTGARIGGMGVVRIGVMIDEMLGQRIDETGQIFRRIVNRTDTRMTATTGVAQMAKPSRSPFPRLMKKPYFENGIWAPK
jgi:hypothetical protein